MKMACKVLSICQLSVALVIALIGSVEARSSEASITRGTTPEGIEYGLWGTLNGQAAPTLFILSGTIEGTLENPTYRQCGSLLAEHGYLCVSIDLPCHGTQARHGEPTGLSGWSHRAARDDDFVAECNARLSGVLDHLITIGVTVPDQVAACGTSRGGFLAIHFAAHDFRVKCVVGFAPVTDLAALSEFRAIPQHPLVGKLSLVNQADKLAGRPVWIVIGDRDDRVGTNHAFEAISRLNAVARQRNIPSRTELHIISEPRGHTTPSNYRIKPPAEWIHRQLTGKEFSSVTPSSCGAAVSPAAAMLLGEYWNSSLPMNRKSGTG